MIHRPPNCLTKEDTLTTATQILSATSSKRSKGDKSATPTSPVDAGARAFLDSLERRTQKRLPQNYYDLDAEGRLRGRSKALGVIPAHEQRRLALMASDERQAPAMRDRAVEMLILTNAGFVEDSIRSHAARGLEAEVLRQECREAIYKAALSYRSDRGANFLSYAHWQMRAAISAAIRNDSRLIRLKSRASEIADRTQRAIKAYAAEGVELNQLTPELLAVKTGDRPERIEEVLPYLTHSPLRLDAPMETSDGQMSGFDVPVEEDFLADVVEEEERQGFYRALSELPPFEQRLLTLYHGLGGEEGDKGRLYDGVYVAPDGSEYSAEQTVIANRRNAGGAPVLALKQHELNRRLALGELEWQPQSEEAGELYQLSGVVPTSSTVRSAVREAERLLAVALDPDRAQSLDVVPAPVKRTAAAKAPAKDSKKKAQPRIKISDLVHAGLVEADERTTLVYKGREFSGVILPDGSLRLDEPEGRVFTALSSAAEAAKGVPADPGWNSWGVRRDGQWVSLFDLRERYKALRAADRDVRGD